MFQARIGCALDAFNAITTAKDATQKLELALTSHRRHQSITHQQGLFQEQPVGKVLDPGSKRQTSPPGLVTNLDFRSLFNYE